MKTSLDGTPSCVRSGGTATPAVIGPAQTPRGARAGAIITDLWAGIAPVGVRAVGGRVRGGVPEALQLGLREGPDEVARLLCAGPAPLDEATANWGSGGRHRYRAREPVQLFLQGLFDHIRGLGLGIRVSPQDLYHGHMFALPASPGGSGELGILFHAQEHPEDIPDGKGRGSGFTTSSPGYANRNLLYLASTNRVYVIDPVGPNRCLLSNLENEHLIPPEISPDRVKAVDESAFTELGVQLPDVNLLPRDLGQPEGPSALFLKAYREPPRARLPEVTMGATADEFDTKALAEALAKILGHRGNSSCALEARRDPGPPPDDPGTGAGGLGGGHDLVSVRCL